MVAPILTGQRKVDRWLKRIGGPVARKLSKKALGKSVKHIAKIIKTEVGPVKTKVKRLRGKKLKAAGGKQRRVHKRSTITKAIGSRNARNKSKKIHEAKAGLTVGKKKNKVARHVHLIALGTKKRFFRGAARGKIKGDRFVRRGFRRARSAIKKIMLKVIRDGLKKERNKGK